MKLLNAGTKENFNYIINKYTLERNNKKIDIVRKYKQYHEIEVNYIEKTILINGVKFTTEYAPGYVYKKMKGKKIACSNFNHFIEHLKESTNKESPFNLSTFYRLKELTKKVNYIY